MRSRASVALGALSVVVGLALAVLLAQQTASLAAFQMWWDDVTVERATAYALLLGGAVILGAALLVAGGIEALRGAP